MPVAARDASSEAHVVWLWSFPCAARRVSGGKAARGDNDRLVRRRGAPSG